MSKRYAVCMPGCNGDALYTLPTIRKLHEQGDVEIDFYTSEVCRPIEQLMRYQSCVSNVIVPTSYVVESKGQGVQPWKMSIQGAYTQVYQLGFQHHPNGPLHLYLAKRAGLQDVPNPVYEYPEDFPIPEEPYAVVCYSHARGALKPDLREKYNYMIENCPIKVVQSGLDVDCTLDVKNSIVYPNLNLLNLLPLIAKARVFVGFYSAPLVLANGFPSVPRIVTLTSPRCGEQHGLHIPYTKDVLTNRKEEILEEVLKALDLQR